MRNYAILILGFFVLLTSCKDEINKLLTFSISHRVTFQVENTSPLNIPINLATPDVTTNSSQTFENNNTSAKYVKDIRLEEIILTIEKPAGKTFSFLKSVKVYISTDQTSEIELASQDNISTTATSVLLTPTNEKLDAYVKASSYKLRVSIITREALTETVDVNADLKFKVTANPL